jgi:hypothetical protein
MKIIETRDHQQIILLRQKALVMIEYLRMNRRLQVGEDQVEFS